MSSVPEILFASDFSVRSDRPLARALRLSDQLARPLTVLHVATKEELERARERGRDLAEMLRASLPPAADGVDLVVATGSAPETIARTAAERGSALIVVGVARRNSLGDYLLGTAVDYVVRNASMPVLVAHNPPYAPYASLVAATDFSDASAKAVLAAATLFPEARLTVLHAAHVPFQGWLDSDETRRQVLDEATAQMEAFLASDSLSGVRARLDGEIAFGPFTEVVHKHVRKAGTDLLVLGTHGHSGFFHATIGSNAEAMLAASPVDVLMVRA